MLLLLVVVPLPKGSANGSRRCETAEAGPAALCDRRNVRGAILLEAAVDADDAGGASRDGAAAAAVDDEANAARGPVRKREANGSRAVDDELNC